MVHSFPDFLEYTLNLQRRLCLKTSQTIVDDDNGAFFADFHANYSRSMPFIEFTLLKTRHYVHIDTVLINNGSLPNIYVENDKNEDWICYSLARYKNE